MIPNGIRAEQKSHTHRITTAAKVASVVVIVVQRSHSKCFRCTFFSRMLRALFFRMNLYFQPESIWIVDKIVNKSYNFHKWRHKITYDFPPFYFHALFSITYSMFQLIWNSFRLVFCHQFRVYISNKWKIFTITI